MPVIALAPLLVVWFGYGPTSKVLVAALIAFFPIVVSTAAGLASLDGSAVTLMESFPASGYEIFVRARLPDALPSDVLRDQGGGAIGGCRRGRRGVGVR